MSTALQSLGALLDSSAYRDKIYAIALELNRPDPAHPERRTYSPAEVRQMCDGFVSLLAEDLLQRGNAMRTLFLETLVPGFVVQGLSTAWIVEWNVSFMVMLACEAVTALPPEHQSAAQHWLSGFSGRYVGEMAEVIATTASHKQAG